MRRLLNIVAAGALAASLAPLPAMAETSAPQKSEIEGIVHDYLLAHPEVIAQAIQKLQTRQQEQEKDQQTQAIAGLHDKIFDSTNQAVIGNPKGKVTLVEFFDYNCGYCKHSLPDMQALVKANPDLRVVMKEFPILSQGSLDAARISVAVKDLFPDEYPRFHVELLGRNGNASTQKALAVAKDLGLDTAALQKQAAKPEVDQNFAEVRQIADALGISGTPSWVIGNEEISGAVGFDALQEKIAAVRSCGNTSC
ncbi:Protein-disulfide isomerase [Faunimonas pinastri]|uniref:Protein-disulfide isomerase n=1 Tax=Faunimonas pinastri TaxID=1855383 RepID=A0A1H9JK87_9HYPH|nr:DsbA family protein [Faunimonas pinastri]SEQ87217.1 Protein-disulfide isomerase [Faunimonas pinastri]